MKEILTILCLLISLLSLGQQITLEEWNKQSLTNKRLLPKYGNLPKSVEETKSDQEFIKAVIVSDSTNKKASDHMIRLGFNYLYRDIKTAMYRFNQAYLLDSTNTDIYWGFGAVYMTLGNYTEAQKQYLEGLGINPESTHLLTDYGTYFLGQYYMLQETTAKSKLLNLDSAISYMTKSYQLDSKDQNTTFRLSICYWNKGDCENAWKFYNICKALGGQPITEEYTTDLEKKCKPKN